MGNLRVKCPFSTQSIGKRLKTSNYRRSLFLPFATEYTRPNETCQCAPDTTRCADPKTEQINEISLSNDHRFARRVRGRIKQHGQRLPSLESVDRDTCNSECEHGGKYPNQPPLDRTCHLIVLSCSVIVLPRLEITTLMPTIRTEIADLLANSQCETFEPR